MKAMASFLACGATPPQGAEPGKGAPCMGKPLRGAEVQLLGEDFETKKVDT